MNGERDDATTKRPQNNQNILDGLCGDLKPTQLIPSPLFAVLRWFLFSLAICFFFILLIDFRSDLPGALAGTKLALSSLLLLLGAGFSAYFTFLSAVPAKRLPRKRSYWLATLFLFAIAPYFFEAPSATGLDGIKCSLTVGLLSLLPGIGFLILLKNTYAAIHPRETGYFLGFATAAIGAMGVALHCASNSNTHVLIWHFLPILWIAFVFSRVSERVLRF